VVALKPATPPSRPKVDGHTCPRHFIVKPLTIAATFEIEQMDSLRVVSVCGWEMTALIPSLSKVSTSDENLEGNKLIQTDELAEQSTGPQPMPRDTV